MAIERANFLLFALTGLGMILSLLFFALALVVRPRYRFQQAAKPVFRFRWVGKIVNLDKDGHTQSFRTSGTVFTPTPEDAHQVANDIITRIFCQKWLVDKQSVVINVRPDPQ